MLDIVQAACCTHSYSDTQVVPHTGFHSLPERGSRKNLSGTDSQAFLSGGSFLFLCFYLYLCICICSPQTDIQTNECLTNNGGCWHDFNLTACKVACGAEKQVKVQGAAVGGVSMYREMAHVPSGWVLLRSQGSMYGRHTPPSLFSWHSILLFLRLLGVKGRDEGDRVVVQRSGGGHVSEVGHTPLRGEGRSGLTCSSFAMTDSSCSVVQGYTLSSTSKPIHPFLPPSRPFSRTPSVAVCASAPRTLTPASTSQEMATPSASVSHESRACRWDTIHQQ